MPNTLLQDVLKQLFKDLQKLYGATTVPTEVNADTQTWLEQEIEGAEDEMRPIENEIARESNRPVKDSDLLQKLSSKLIAPNNRAKMLKKILELVIELRTGTI
jgi:hypothetical protein